MNSYVKMKKKACIEMGFDFKLYEPEETIKIKEEKLIEKTKEFNDDPMVDGLIIQLPLPEHLDSFKIINLINPLKDVDGLCKSNVGALALGNPDIYPCTPYGIYTILKEANIETKQKHVVMVGKSKIFFKQNDKKKGGRKFRFLKSQHNIFIWKILSCDIIQIITFKKE